MSCPHPHHQTGHGGLALRVSPAILVVLCLACGVHLCGGHVCLDEVRVWIDLFLAGPQLYLTGISMWKKP